jgi:tetratricopeptide (TPR) repeat protein
LSRMRSLWVFGLLVVAPLVLSPQSTRADDWADCAPQGVADKIVASCTAVIDQAARSKDDLAKAHARRGFQLERLGQKDRALADFTRSVELDPTNPAGYMGRGFYYAQQQDWAKALAEFDQAIARAPNDARIHTARGRALVNLGQVEAAIASHNRAIAINPMLPDGLY